MKNLFFVVLISGLLALSATAQKTETKTTPKKTTKPAVSVKKATPVKFTTCMVTGEDLGTMGKPLMVKYKGQDYPVCCAGCKPKFEKEPEKYIKSAMARMKSAPTKPASKKA